MQDKIDSGEKPFKEVPATAALRAIALYFLGHGAQRRIGTFFAHVAVLTSTSTLVALGAVVFACYVTSVVPGAASLLELAASIGCSSPVEVASQAHKLAVDIGWIALQLGLATGVTVSLARITAPAARAARNRAQK